MKQFFRSAIVLVMLTCSSCVNKSNDNEANELDSLKTQRKTTMSSEAINEIIKSVPSPIELTSLIKESGADYNSDILNNTSNANSYTKSFNKAINLGIYGADLGYINIYEKTYASIEYLNTIRSVAEDLKLGQFFDFETLKRLASNNKKLDSIVYISTSSFEKMNNYLAKQKRDNISILMLIGGWVESLHLASTVALQTYSKDLIDRVAEQKISLDQMIILLTLFKDDPAFINLSKDINRLKILFDAVKITYEYHEPVTKEVDGMLVVEDSSTSKIEVSKAQFIEIAQTIEEIRNSFIKI